MPAPTQSFKKTLNTQGQKRFIPWYKHKEIEENLVNLSSSLIHLDAEIHIGGSARVLLDPKLKNTVAVSDNGDGTYTLVAGLNSFVRAKVHDLEVAAFITKDGREIFKNKYNFEI
ncbi:MAG: hypothetical protein RR817_10940 [Niameybacter sp.]